MPRSSKHKSSKHSSRDARDYSDSERDSGVKDRKSKEESAAKASKDSSSAEKRRLDSKEAHGNGEYSDEYASSSKRRKDGGGGDRWNGGEEGSKKSKASGDSKSSRRRDGSVGVYGEGEEVKRSSGKHRDSSSSGRKESREGVVEKEKEKERKFKEGRSEESVDDQEQRLSKQVFENNDSKKLDELRSPELDNQLERRMRKKRDDYGDGDKHQDDVGDGYDRHLSSRDDIAKDGKKKDDRRKDEKYRDKYREEIDRENKHRHDKQRDERPAKDHTSIRSDDKHSREEKNSLELRQKRTKHPENDRDYYRDRDGERDRDFESARDRERHNERDHDRDYDLDRDHDYDRDRDWDWDRDRDRDLDRDRDRDRDRHRDRDGSHVDDRSARGKEGGTKKRTLDDRDDYSDSKSRAVKSFYPDAEKRSLSSSRADSDVDRGRSQPRQAHADSTGTSNKHRSSPASNTHIGKDEYRNANAEDTKYRDSTIEQRTKGSREGYSGISDRAPKYKLMEKPVKIDECPAGDLSTERSSSAKASPMGLIERSPSSTSIERRYVNKSGVKRNLEIDESGRRSSTDARDFSSSDDRLALEKPLLDEPSQTDLSFYGRTNHSNPSAIPTPPGFRATLDRPYMGSLEDDARDNSNTRYRRSSEPGFGRAHGGNSWRAVPNWTSPVPNGFVPFPPGPAHGGFQAMMPQFTSQPLFGVRPPMEVNHAGIPYHIADADRFPGHLRPLGWPNLMDGTGPAHLHGWDSNNGVFRDDPHIYGGSDWDRNRHPTNSHGWESGSETWKEQNSDSKKDLPSPACKDESVPALGDNCLTDQSLHTSHDEHNRDEFNNKSPETKLSSVSSPAKLPLNSLPTTVPEKVPDTSTPNDITSLFSRFYLSKLDISVDLVLPELYDQCMCALNVGKIASIDAVDSTELSLKNGSRARQKYAATLSSHSPFPVIDNSIFQRAVDLYKKHRIKLPNGGDVDVIAAANQVQVDESVPTPSLENRLVSAPTSDGTKDVLMPTLEPNKVETLSPAKEDLEDINQTCSEMEQDHDCTHSLKVAMSSPSSGAENQEAAVTVLQETEDKGTSDKVNSVEAEENYSTASKTEAQLAPALHEEVDNMNSKTITTGFAHCAADEKLGFGDTKVNPLIFEDGSPKACDALMPGSNESESLILSRIHHSPESTH